MGRWALSDFREELGTVFSSRGIANNQLDRWINAAKVEVESSEQFEANKVATYFETVSGQRDYNLVSGFLSVVSIGDVTSDKALIRTDIENIDLRSRDKTGSPVFWARSGDRIVLSPTPDAKYEIEVVVIKESGDLVLPTDTTAIPATWDNAIYFLSAHYGWLALNEKEEAGFWFERFINYMRTRMSDHDWEGTSRSEPVRVINNLRDLRRR